MILEDNSKLSYYVECVWYIGLIYEDFFFPYRSLSPSLSLWARRFIALFCKQVSFRNKLKLKSNYIFVASHKTSLYSTSSAKGPQCGYSKYP